MAENVNGSYKNELIHTRLWTDVVDVEIATFEWVNWWNESRGPDPRKVDTSGVSYAAWVSVADVSASKVSGARRLHQECRLRV
ncbi:IS3 family transposase, partial [Corynebacterium striatum]|uniref:IS3 family transposase n=1 Tax=Corynebacterium striatum TaxID=43770 RepID=UPI003B5C0A07